MEPFSCVHADVCAGCPLIHLPYADQLLFKEKRLREAMVPYPALGAAIEHIVAAEARDAYRVRAKLMVSAAPDARGDLVPALGLFARGRSDGARPKDGRDHAVVDIPRCRVLRPRLMTIAAGLRGLLREPPEGVGPCFVPEAMGGRLSAFDLREVAGTPRHTPEEPGLARRPGVLVTLVLRSGQEPSKSELDRATASIRSLSPDILGVAVNYRPEGATQVLGSATRVLWGAELACDPSGSAYHLASYGSFVQAHRGQADRIEVLLSSALARLGIPPAMRLLDLYGGSGALSLPFATNGARVTLVESFRPAAASAARAAALQGITDFAVRVGDAARVLGALARQQARFDVIVTNPPRRGMAPDVRKAAAAMRPRAIAYISCDPETLARDLAHFARLGYGADRLHPVDMIPLTDQVETVAILTPRSPPPLAVAYEDADVCIVEKPAHAVAQSTRRGDTRLVGSASEDTSGFAVWSSIAPPDGLALRHVYLVLSRGIMAARGRVGKGASYARVAKLNGHSLLRITLEPGHASDLRRDLARRGHPVVGDRRMGHEPTNRHFEERHMLDRPFLHCVELAFSHPRTRSTIEVRSDLPGELGMVLTRLGHLASMSRNE